MEYNTNNCHLRTTALQEDQPFRGQQAWHVPPIAHIIYVDSLKICSNLNNNTPKQWAHSGIATGAQNVQLKTRVTREKKSV